MDSQWSKLETVLSVHKFTKLEDLDIEKWLQEMGLKSTNIELSHIVPTKVRMLFIELSYQIQKYNYLHSIIDYDSCVHNEREKHIK